MTDDKTPQNAAPVDFVVGANTVDAQAEELLDDVATKHTDRRFVVGLGIAAVVFVGIVVFRSNISGSPTSASMPSTHSTTSSAAVLPSYGVAASATAKPAVVELGRDLCPPNRGCFNASTPAVVMAEVRAAVTQTFGKLRQLHVRDAYIPLDDPPRRSLFARSITATTPRGTVDIVAAAIDPNSNLDVMGAEDGNGSRLGMHAAVNGYVIYGSVAVAEHENTKASGGALYRLISDPHIVAKS